MLRGSLGLGLCLCISVGCSSGDAFESRPGAGGSGKGGSSAGGSSSGSSGSSGSVGSSGAGGRDAGSGASAGTGKGGTGGAGGSAASGGKQGAGGSSGSGGTSGGGGSSGGGGTSGGGGSSGGGTAGSSGGGMGGGTSGGGGTGGQMPCTWGMSNNCPTGSFCNAMGCGTGTCMAIPNEGSTRAPVCGCDGLTYWNASVAAHRGMSVKSAGVCTVPAVCGGFGSLQCPGVAYCNYQGEDGDVCLISDVGGSCWVMPNVCPTPGVGFGPRTRACDEARCTEECPLIKAEKPFFVDSTCPQ